MKIMFLYPNHEGFFRCRVGLTVIMTVVANAGHKVELFDTTFISAKENIDDTLREKGGFVPKTTSTHLFNQLPQEEIESSWIKAIEKFKPDIIGTTIVEDFYEYCDNLLGLAKKKFNSDCFTKQC